MTAASGRLFPEGLDERHSLPRQGLHRHASPISFLLLAAILGVALAGFLGGGPASQLRVSGERADLTVTAPERVDNGTFFEIRFQVDAKDDLADAVIAIAPAYWRDLTINTMIPAAADERFEDGSFRFSFGPLKRGEQLVWKVDGQVNPPLLGGTTGTIAVYDGSERLLQMPVKLRVLP